MSRICRAMTLVGIDHLAELVCAGTGVLGGIFTGGGMRTGVVRGVPFLVLVETGAREVFRYGIVPPTTV